MFSMTQISTDKTYPTNGSKEIKYFQRQWFNIEYIRRKNVQYFRPFINIKTIKNKFIFIHYSYTLLEVLGTFKIYTTTFDKTHISKYYVVKRHGGNLLEKESLIYYVLHLPTKLIHFHIMNSQRKTLKIIHVTQNLK